MNSYSLEDKYSYSLGMSLTIEALLHQPDKMRKVLLSHKANINSQFEYLLDLCKKNNIETVYDDKTIEKLSVKENCYCIGFFDKYHKELTDDDHVLLYQFNDYGELGTVFRSAISFDYHNIVLIDSDIDYFDPRCIRSSMGSFFQINIVKYNDLNEYKKDYPDYHLYSFIDEGKDSLDNIRPLKPSAFLLPQNYHSKINIQDSYYLEHNNKLDDISLSIRSSIILEHLYYLKRKR